MEGGGLAPHAALGLTAGRVLHAGCGGDPLPDWLALEGCEETRLDIDPAHEPDIVASMTACGDIGPYDTVLCQHALEHLYPYDVPRALGEFYRVLTPGGRVIIVVPDLEDVRPTEEVLYTSPAGPVCGLDMYYGMHSLLEAMPHMAHHSGFTSTTIKAVIEGAGFRRAIAQRMAWFTLLAIGVK